MLRSFVDLLNQGQSLDGSQVIRAVEQLISERVEAETKAEFLSALARKGETREELAAFARELRDKSIPLPVDDLTRTRPLLDVCGTGGDRLNTFNISTTVAILVAAAGVSVAKHGNRAITSRSGSADVLEALGIRIDRTPEESAQMLRDHQFTFLFAQRYHPAFRHIGPARKLCADRGQRTLFNFLGPLLNPARPTCQLIGVPHPELCTHVAKVLQTLGIQRGMVVSGRVGDRFMDELSTLGSNTIAEFYSEHGFSESRLEIENLPLQPVRLEHLEGGSAEFNAGLVRGILKGNDRGPRREAVLLNASAALLVAGRADSILGGWEMAAETIDSGRGAAKLKELARA